MNTPEQAPASIISRSDRLRTGSATPASGDSESGRGVRWESERSEAELHAGGIQEAHDSIPLFPAFRPRDDLDDGSRAGRVQLHDDGVARGGELTPEDRHHLNRILVNLELQREMSALSQIGTLAKYGAPFAPHANGPNSRPGASSTAPPPTPAKTGFLGGIFGGGNGTTKSKKESQFEGYEWDASTVEESPIYQYLFWRFIYNMPALDSAKPSYWQEQIQPFFDSFAERDLSSTVERSEITKRRMLSLGIVRIVGTYYSTCVRPIQPSTPARPSASMRLRLDLTVPGNMESLWRAVCPEGDFADCPTWLAVAGEKGRGTDVTYRIVVRAADKAFVASRTFTDCRSLASALANLDSKNKLDLPAFPLYGTTRTPARAIMQRYLRLLLICLAAPAKRADPADVEAARSEVQSFLLRDGPASIESLKASFEKCEEEDRVADKRHQRWVKIGQKAADLQTAWRNYRQKLIDGDELDRTMEYAKKFSKTTQLPQLHQDAVQWASIWFGQALHWIFVGAATGPEVFNILRSFHEMIPYGPVKVGLSLVNPTLAIKAIVHLILGQPAGQLSLFQRIWSHVCNSANKHQRKLIERFRKRIRNDALCNALKAHVRAGYVQRQKTKQEAVRRNEDIVLTIIRERGTKAEYELVKRWHDEFLKSDADPHASSGAKQFGDLKELLAAYYRYRDREQVLQIALEPNTPRLLHASISVFYGAIHAVAKISDLPGRVADTQAFLDDLCRVCLSGNTEPSEFIKLANRHYEKAYYFLHELASKGGPKLDPILGWAHSGLAFIRKGIPCDPARPESERAGVDIDGLFHARDGVEHLLDEARRMADWTVLKKARSDVYLRLDLLRADTSAADKDDDNDDDWLDRSDLWQSFLAQSPADEQERFTTAANEQAHELRRTGPGGDLEWAWWAARETAGAAGKAGVVKAHQESAADAVRKSSVDYERAQQHHHQQHHHQQQSMPRRKSGESLRRFSLDTGGGSRRSSRDLKRPSLDFMKRTSSQPNDLAGKLAVPPPEVEATRSVLGQYLDQVKGYLGAAKKHQVR